MKKRYYYDERYDLIREVVITEVKTQNFRIENDACFVTFVDWEELFDNLKDIMKHLDRKVARVSFMDGQAAREVTI